MTLDAQGLRSDLAGPFSLTLPGGTCLAIQGPSGSGKSLLLRMLADLDPCEGRVALDGIDRQSMPATVWRQRVGLVPARSGWWAEQVGDHFDASQSSKRAALAERMLLAPAIFGRTVDEVSTGERQRLALIRALLAGPQVLLLDEPTASLDGVATLAVETVLTDSMARGTGIVLVTHDPAQATRLATQTLHMRDGALVSA